MTRQDFEGFVRRRQRAWADRDAHALTIEHAPDSVVESPTHGTLTTTRDIQCVYQTWFDAFPDVKYEVDDTLFEGDRGVIFFHATGTHMQPFLNVPPTGKKLEINGALLLTFREGKIVHEKRYYDATALMLQIGLLRAKPGV